jgi:N-acetylglucosamine malate deacetylase 1
MSRVLVLSPHPDDEAIGCGGTLNMHAVNGDDIYTIFLTSGERGGHGLSKEETTIIREQEARVATAVLGIQKIDFWHERNGALRATKNLISKLSQVIVEWKPNYIYVPHNNEMHPDHRGAARLLRLSLCSLPVKNEIDVRMFEVWTPLSSMDEIIDITPYIKTKIKAIRKYKSQCRYVKFDEAILGLNRYRGEFHSWPGGDYAEIFLRMKL